MFSTVIVNETWVAMSVELSRGSTLYLPGETKKLYSPADSVCEIILGTKQHNYER